MSKRKTSNAIRLRGVRQNNLKNFDLDLPLNELIVITGPSGSGKSSLAFDTLYAEGQRRYIETFSPYTRQFFDRMDKPKVDSIEGIPPAIAIEQRNTVKTTRSTVGTMTEICEHMKQLWPLVSTLHCRQCDQPVTKDSPGRVWEQLSVPADTALLITFDLPLAEKLSLSETLDLIGRQGYQRLLVDDGAPLSDDDSTDVLRETTANEYRVAASSPERIIRLEEAAARYGDSRPSRLTIVQDRVKYDPKQRARFVEACEQAYHFGKGRLAVHVAASGDSPAEVLRFSRGHHCARCDIDYREASPAMFSFNHPVGACPTCKGFGRVITIDYSLALPDRSKTLAEGVVKPWQTETGAESQADLEKFCRKRKVPMDVPFRDLPEEQQRWVIDGDPDYGVDAAHQWPKAWYGVKGYFRWLESKAYKMHVRVLLSRYRAYRLCPDCRGERLQPDSLLHRVATENNDARWSLPDFYRQPVRRALGFIEHLIARLRPKSNEPLGLVLNEVRSRLDYLNEIGLGYLTLDRPTRSLSGGETERVNLTSCLGSRLVNTLYVLDEPSVGLHPTDTQRLVKILEGLRDAGNTVVVVEHESGVMNAADRIIDLGPGHGSTGGELVFQGTFKQALQSRASLTGAYLSGRTTIPVPEHRPVDLKRDAKLVLTHAARHNLKDLTVEIPLNRLIAITGVSGSGKTTLVREVLLPALRRSTNQADENPVNRDRDEDEDSDETDATEPVDAVLTGAEHIGRVVLVDQSPIGRTPRSNPAVYIGAFDDIRELFAQTGEARRLGLNASAFSFNSAQGQCAACRGSGYEKIEMQFLSDVFIRCPECDGRRYRGHILEVKLVSPISDTACSIADVLELTVDDAVKLFAEFEDSKPARKAREQLELMREVGLGYLHLGQPVNTLSGGECQRLKLVGHLAEHQQAHARVGRGKSDVQPERPTLFLFDEPTTGLHFDDVRVLLEAFQKLVDGGHTVIVIEHHLDVIKCADWVIDLGPGAGDEGGELVIAGPPEAVANHPESRTGEVLRDVLQ